MSKSTRGTRVAGIASLAVTLSIGVAAPAFAAPGFDLTRVAGDDRYETAVEAAEIYGASDDVILANGQPGEYADALAGNYLAGVEDAPILLTKRSGLPAVTKAQIDDIDPANIWVVGGEAAVPADQVAALEADGYNVERVSGDDRFATNAAVIAKGDDAKGGLGLIATGLNFPDALAAGPFAYQGHSLGLVRTNSVPDVVGDALEADGVTKVLIFGGADVVGAGVVSDLAARGITVEDRFDGADRSETSELAAEYAVSELNFTDEHIGVASGYTDGFGADALAGGPVEGNELSPMLITRNVDNPDDVLDYIAAHDDSLADGHIYGGTAAISAAAEAAMEEAGQGEGNQDFTVGDGTSATNVASSVGSNSGAREYSVSGLTAGTVYDIRLFPSENVTTTAGVVSFRDTNPNNGLADPGTTPARIEQVNNSAVVPAAHVEATADASGTIKFLVDSTEPDSIVPVLWLDAEAAGTDDDQLDLNADDTPSEEFGVGGSKTWTPQEAADQNPIGTDSEVTAVDKANNTFTLGTGAGARVYFYGANDTFQMATAATTADEPSTCNAVSQADWEAALSVGDQIDQASKYFNEGDTETANDGPSTFCLEDLNPDKTVNVTAVRTSDTTVRVDIKDDDVAQDSFNIYRASGNQTADDCSNVDFTNSRTGWTMIANVVEDGDTTAPEETYTDSGLTANTTYCYVVVAVNDGDEGPASDEQTVTTLPAGETAAPESVDAYLQTDEAAGPFSTLGTVSTGDVWRVAFDERLAALGDPTAEVFEIRDGDGNTTLVDCNDSSTGTGETEATCTLNTGTVTIDGVEYTDGEVLSVTVDTVGTVAGGGNGTLEYPVTVTQAAGFQDFDGDGQWTPADDADHIIDDEADPKTEGGAGTF